MPPKSKKPAKITSSNLSQKEKSSNPFLHLFDENPEQYLPSGVISFKQFVPDKESLDEINLNLDNVYSVCVVPNLLEAVMKMLERRERFKVEMRKRVKDFEFQTTPVCGNTSSKIRNLMGKLRLRLKSPIKQKDSCQTHLLSPIFSSRDETITVCNEDTGPQATSTPFVYQGDRADKGMIGRFGTPGLCLDKMELSPKKTNGESNSNPLITKRKSDKMIPSSPTSFGSPAPKAVRVGKTVNFSEMVPKKKSHSPVILEDVEENFLTVDDETSPLVSLIMDVSHSKTPAGTIQSSCSAKTMMSNYDIADFNDEDETDYEDAPKKKIPQWAQIKNVQKVLDNQCQTNADSIFGEIKPLILTDLCKSYDEDVIDNNQTSSSDYPLHGKAIYHILNDYD
uniref:INCENP_ARK-bind domain-containing protein n=1 Tax=Rhabditophanes sp. KR3021 TaxID=114890 RepID=A0AC35TNF4_9BILA